MRISDAEYAPTAPGLRSIADQCEPVEGNEQTVQSTTPTITFEDINFAYGAGLPNAISGVSFEIEAGQQVAVVGRSGSGKSTLLKLMRGALVPDSGRVLIDGSELADVDSNKRNRIFGAALQNAKLFTGTIRENIGFNTDEDQVERIKEAARQVNAHQFIEALPFGYETTVGANGRSLPAGRVQRICLARSVFHAPSVVVWDEATAAMDIDSERRLYNRIEAWPTDRTSIIATRRLRNIQNADIILVMSEGAIVEQGTHPELIDTRGLYYYLCCQHAME
jgi:ATP-binding cassette subfamily B protein